VIEGRRRVFDNYKRLNGCRERDLTLPGFDSPVNAGGGYPITFTVGATDDLSVMDHVNIWFTKSVNYSYPNNNVAGNSLTASTEKPAALARSIMAPRMRSAIRPVDGKADILLHHRWLGLVPGMDSPCTIAPPAPVADSSLHV